MENSPQMKETQQSRRPESTLREPSLVVISASSTGLKVGFRAWGTQQKWVGCQESLENRNKLRKGSTITKTPCTPMGWS